MYDQSAFVVSTGRCGSTLLSKMLQRHTALLSISEFFSVLGGDAAFRAQEVDGSEFWNVLRLPSEDTRELAAHAPDLAEWLHGRIARAEASDLSPLLLIPLPQLTPHTDELLREIGAFARAQPRRAIEAHYTSLFEWLRARMGKQLWVERSGGSSEYLARLIAGWPEAKFIHMFRAGFDCALSMSRHAYFRVRVARLVARDSSLPVADCLRRTLPLDRYGAYWSALMLSTKRDLEKVDPRRVLHLCYEDLLESPRAELQRIALFLGVADDEQWYAQSRSLIGTKTGRTASVDAAERAALERACRPGMRIAAQLRSRATGRT